jgi:hypothetical protein
MVLVTLSPNEAADFGAWHVDNKEGRITEKPHYPTHATTADWQMTRQ